MGKQIDKEIYDAIVEDFNNNTDNRGIAIAQRLSEKLGVLIKLSTVNVALNRYLKKKEVRVNNKLKNKK